MQKLIRVGIILTSIFILRAQDLSTLKNMAVEKSPLLNLLKAKLNAAENKIPQVSNLADPMLVIGLNNLPVSSFKFDEEPMTSKSISISQAFPFFGKLNSAEAVAAADIPIILEELNENTNQIIFEVTNAYLDFNLFVESKNTVEQNKNLYQTLLEIVRIKYQVSKASQQDIFKLELKLDRLDEKIQNIETGIVNSKDKIENIIYAGFEPFSNSDSFDISKYPINTKEGYLNLAIANRPLLKNIDAKITKAEKIKSLSHYSFYPDFTVTLQYAQRDKLISTANNLNDFLSVKLGMNLPLNYGGKTDAKIAEALSYIEVFEKQYEQSLQLLKISINKSHNLLENYISNFSLYQNTMQPRAYASFEASLGSYKTNEADILDVINSVDQILDLKLNIIKNKFDFLKELAKIEFLTGTNLFTPATGGNYEK